MNITNILTLPYWFAFSTPPFRQPSLAIILILLTAFFAGGIALKIIAKKNKSNPPLSKGLRRLSRPLFFFSILGLILVGCRQVGAAILSSRSWILLILVIAAVWFALISRATFKTYKTEYEKIKERRKYEEYLPKKKK